MRERWFTEHESNGHTFLGIERDVGGLLLGNCAIALAAVLGRVVKVAGLDPFDDRPARQDDSDSEK